LLYAFHRALYGPDNPRIRPATADIAVHAIDNLLARWPGIRFEKSRRLHDLP
jgi:hypothetical protein